MTLSGHRQRVFALMSRLKRRTRGSGPAGGRRKPWINFGTLIVPDQDLGRKPARSETGATDSFRTSRFDPSLCKQSGHRRDSVAAREDVCGQRALFHAQVIAQQALEDGAQIGGGLEV